MGTKVYDNALDLITFTRASGGTALRKISYGPELVTNGGFNNASDWTLGTGWSISSGTLNSVTGSSTDAYQPVPFVSGKIYQVTLTVSNRVSGSVNIRLLGSASGLSSSDFVSANGVYTFILVAPVTVGEKRVSIGRGFTNVDLSIDNVSVKEVLFDRPDGTLTLFNHPTNVPRIEYDASGAVKGLLVEEARTNLLLRSEEFDNASWVKAGTTITANAATAPDGSTTADSLFSSAANNSHYIRQNLTVVAGSLVATYYVKYINWPRVSIRVFDGTTGTWFSTFNIQTGVVTNAAAGVTATITDVGNGWYRLSASVLAASGAGFSELHFANSDIYTGAVYVGSATDEVLLWGAQLEAGAFPTSYIPTAGATATRAADIASIPVSAFGYNQQAGSVVVEYAPITPYSGPYVFQLDNGTNGNRIYWQMTGASPSDLTVGTIGAATSLLLVGADVFSDNSFVKTATGIALNNCGLSVDSGSVIVDTTYSGLALPVTHVRIGYLGHTSSSQANGYIKSIAYYPRRLSNAQLQELTT